MITSAQSTKEMYLFKNEIYNKIREIEIKLSTELKTKNSEINANLTTFNEKVSSILESNKLMIESITKQNYNFEKIEKLEISKNAMNEMIFSHKLKLTNIYSEINKIKYRFDKMVNENIIMPGYVGPGNEFKNLAEFIISTVKEIKKLKEEKDQIKKDNRELKTKVDLLMRNMSSMLEYNSSKIKELANIKNNEIESILDSKMKKYEKSLNSQMKLEEKIKEIGIEIGKINDSQINVNEIIKNKFEEIKKMEEEMNGKLLSALKEVEEVQKMKEELNDKIKNISFKASEGSKNKYMRRPNKLKTGILKNNNINSLKNKLDNSNHRNSIKAMSILPKKNNKNVNIVNNAFSLNKELSDKKTIISEEHNSKKDLNININSNILTDKKIIFKENIFRKSSKTLKFKDIIKSFDKEIETIETKETKDNLLTNPIKDNIFLNEGKNIRGKIFEKTLTNFSKDNKKILTNAGIQNLIKENKIKKEQKIKLAKYSKYTKENKILDKVLSMSDDEEYKRTKTLQNDKKMNSSKEEKNNKNIGTRNIHIVDCNLVNLNLIQVPNINDNNLNYTSNNDTLYDPLLKIRKIKSVDSKRPPKILNDFEKKYFNY